MMGTTAEPTWDEIRPIIERTKDDDALKNVLARALDRWITACLDGQRANSDDFPAYLLEEYRKEYP